MQVGSEESFGLDADVLTGSTFFLGETFTGNAITGNGSLTANIAFSGHGFTFSKTYSYKREHFTEIPDPCKPRGSFL